ncbi:MAG: PAS domain-containing protein [Alphaproteobacteria bacterium]|nr:PAS domain-containing protein [Alphaproteobacteria bacterium]
MRVTDGARGLVARSKDRIRELEDVIARADAVFGAHPGVVLIWAEDQPGANDADWGAPRMYGSPLALASLLRFSDSSIAADPAVRMLQGLSGFEATDATGGSTRLAPALARLRREGAPFSLTISTPAGVFIEIDGRTAGARAVVWVIDASVRGVEEGGARGRLDEARQVIARDPAAFLEVLAQAPFMSWRVSGGLKLEWANPPYLEVLEARSLEHAISRNMSLDQSISEQARRVIDSGQASDEVHPLSVRGERRAFRVHMIPVGGGAAGMAFDVTEAEIARETLARQSKAHDETLNSLAEGVAVFDAERRLVFFNRAFAEMWELDAAFLQEKPTHAAWLDALKQRRKLPAHANYPEWRAGELAHYQDVSDLRQDLWVLPDGRTLRIVRQRHPLGGLLLVFSDMTNELTLRSQYNALLGVQKAALDRLHEAIAVFGLDGRMKLSNASFAKLWGIAPDEIEADMAFDDVVEHCRHLFHDRTEWANIRARITDPSPEARQEFRGQMRRSDETVVDFLTRPLPDGATLVAFLDITDSQRVQNALHDRAEALEAADRLKTEFVQNVSYQLRNPLQAIHGNAEMLAQRLFGPLNDRQTDQVGAIIEASDTLTKLVENILDLASIEAGGVELDVSIVDLRTAFEDSVQLAASKARDAEVTIKIDVDPAIANFKGDEKRIRQILFHLLSNAYRASDRGDEITIGAHKIDGMVRVFVSDTGVGIPFESQAAAFDSFESGDRRGAGLGLALVRSFVEMHGGWVALQSEPGRGTTVSCHFPMLPKPSPPAPKPLPPLELKIRAA